MRKEKRQPQGFRVGFWFRTALYRRRFDLYYWAYVANKTVGLTERAKEIRDKYLDTVNGVFERTGKIFEKYDATTGDMTVFNEYGLPEMLGWTAGVFQAFYQDYRKENE